MIHCLAIFEELLLVPIHKFEEHYSIPTQILFSTNLSTE